MIAVLLASITPEIKVQRLFKIRTITAGLTLTSAHDLASVESAIAFLQESKKRFEDAGYEIQTLRITTQPLPEYLNGKTYDAALDDLKTLDHLVSSKNVLLNIGPILTEDRYDPELAGWAVRLVRETRNINFSLTVASPDGGVYPNAARTASEIIVALAGATEGGVGNFRFTASANCPPGIPFFPAGYHRGEPDFAIGLETPNLLKAAFEGARGIEDAKARLSSSLEAELAPIEKTATGIAKTAKLKYSGIDVSPAPSRDASIGAAIEALTGKPFGSAGTLEACAAITDVLHTLKIRRCGYSGLMLPVLEDPVLARRAAEGRYGVRELLLYSSVCGTGLDVVPLPGDSSAGELAALIRDVAAMSIKLHKPLSARLFPIPGKRAGDQAKFDDPFLNDSVVMKLD
jgi:uncharacterized protein (UPF0210 family)